MVFAGPASSGNPNSAEARNLAELMCRQLPNVATILETIQVPPNVPNDSIGPATEPPVTDDVYDALVWLGRSSLPCLTNRLTFKVVASVADILERELDSTIKEWLKRVNLISELTDIPLNDVDRTGHLPKLFEDLLCRLRPI